MGLGPGAGGERMPTNREVEVYVDLEGQAHLAGRLWSRVNKGREGASFAYDALWLASPLRFPLERAVVGNNSIRTQNAGCWRHFLELCGACSAGFVSWSVSPELLLNLGVICSSRILPCGTNSWS